MIVQRKKRNKFTLILAALLFAAAIAGMVWH
jgi:hypothetical protein